MPWTSKQFRMRHTKHTPDNRAAPAAACAPTDNNIHE
jgi:hypothetical protein